MTSREQGTTLKALQQPLVDDDRLFLAVIGDGTVLTYDLPETGTISIGRSDDNDVAVDDPLISRHHAILHLGPPLEIQDLGGTNGTRVSGVALAREGRAVLRPGQMAEVGTTMLVVQQRLRSPRRRRVWPHGYFEMQLAEECAARAEGRRPFAVLSISTREADSALVEGALADVVAASDVVARYAPGEYELMLHDAAAARASSVAKELRRSLAAHEPRVGIALYPEDAQTADALLAKVREELRPNARDQRGRPILADPAMINLYRMADRVARGKISVLILGETGVGKELLAERIHASSPRSRAAFVAVNCGAIAESLLEAELFGYEKGAFTGAERDKAGFFEAAHGGTLFLDEVGELPPAVQVKLLRTLEKSEVQRVGSVRPLAVDVRIVAATNRNVEAEILKGRFRQDLFYRLNGVTLTIPSLRERATEIPILAQELATRAAVDLGAPPRIEFSPRAMEQLQRYDWPGNIRELKNVVERAVLLSADGRIDLEHLPLEKMSASWLASPADPERRAGLSQEDDDERLRLSRALEQTNGNQTRAAKLLGMSRQALVRRLVKYDLPRPQTAEDR